VGQTSGSGWGSGPIRPFRLRRRSLLAIACVVPVALWGACARAGPTFDRRLTIAHGGTATVVHVAVARTEEERERGLMDVRALPPDTGMEFEFAAPTTRGFWMKDTLVSLSVAFWDRTGRIVAILDMAPCRRDPCPIYSPHAPYV